MSFDTSSVTSNMTHMFWVHSPPMCPAANLHSQVLRVHVACAAAAPRPPASRPASRPASHMPPFRLGRAQTPCPTPTSCRFVAHGRATRPSPLLAMPRAGVREAANRAPSARSIFVCVCLAEAESMATALSRSPLYVRGGHLHALEEAVRCSLYTSTGRYGLGAVLWHSAREV